MSNIDYGVKVGKSAYNTENAKPWKHLVYSPYPLLKLAQSGTGSIVKTAGNTDVTVTIAHNLGYIPICYVIGKYLDYDGNVTATYTQFCKFEYAGLQTYNSHYYYADDTNLYLYFSTVNSAGSTITLPYYYYIFYDEDAV
jgi:hypothetical protein